MVKRDWVVFSQSLFYDFRYTVRLVGNRKNESEKNPESGAVKGTTFQAATYAIPMAESIFLA